MLISEISLKNFKSFGNNEQKLKLDTEKGDLILIVGNNGNGKSVDPNTEIEVEFSIDNFEVEDILKLLDIMGEGSHIIEYIKENNIQLYEKLQRKYENLK